MAEVQTEQSKGARSSNQRQTLKPGLWGWLAAKFTGKNPVDDDQPVKPLRDAVGSVEFLLAYAAENRRELPSETRKTVVAFGQQFEKNEYTPEAEDTFWQHYSDLCAAVQPATVETLRYTTQYDPNRKSEAAKTVKNYQVSSIMILCILLIIQIYWALLYTLLSDIEKLENFAQEVQKANIVRQQEQLSEFERQKNKGLEIGKFKENSNTVFKKQKSDGSESESGKISEESEKIAMDRILFLNSLNAITNLEEIRVDDTIISNLLIFKDRLLAKNNNSMNDNLKKLESSVSVSRDSHGDLKTKGDVQESGKGGFKREHGVRQLAELYVHVIGVYILPILYGTMGACAYIFRTLSQHVKNRTFGTETRVRLRLRLFLGALAGFSVAWFVRPDETLGNIGPFALAFLAGYSVELVFHAMDAVIGSFTRGTEGKPTQSSPT